MEEIVSDYLKLLESVDSWFAKCLQDFGSHIQCDSGCSHCCRGLFDITLLDAFLLKLGFDRLSEKDRRNVQEKAKKQIILLQEEWPEFQSPYILNWLPAADWEQMPEEDETPCPLLSEKGHCLLYEFRPMTCRLHGLPLVDLSGEIFDEDWCSMNFSGTDPLGLVELRWEFRDLFKQELELFKGFANNLLGKPVSELDTFIPSALLIDFERTNWNLNR